MGENAQAIQAEVIICRRNVFGRDRNPTTSHTRCRTTPDPAVRIGDASTIIGYSGLRVGSWCCFTIQTNIKPRAEKRSTAVEQQRSGTLQASAEHATHERPSAGVLCHQQALAKDQRPRMRAVLDADSNGLNLLRMNHLG